jgi:hypothetical protein
MLRDFHQVGMLCQRSSESLHRGASVGRDLARDNSCLSSTGRTKINSFNPVLTAVRTAHPTPPFLPFCHHQSSWPAFDHVAVSHLDRWIDYAAIYVSDLLQVMVTEIHV